MVDELNRCTLMPLSFFLLYVHVYHNNFLPRRIPDILLIQTRLAGTGLTDMDTGLIRGIKPAIFIRTRAIHIRVPGGYTIPVSNTRGGYPNP